MLERIFREYDCDTPHRAQGIFCSIFIHENRLQTACEKIQKDISMKRWLLLAMLERCPEPRTLSNVGKLMGCSRQNVKKLAVTLEKKGYLRLVEGENNSLCLEPTGKIETYSQELAERRAMVLQLLFSEFSEEEIAEFYRLYWKLNTGMARVEEYVKED